jgi:hypothetical protein
MIERLPTHCELRVEFAEQGQEYYSRLWLTKIGKSDGECKVDSKDDISLGVIGYLCNILAGPPEE